MGKGLEDDDSSLPSVQQVEGIKREIQPVDQRVVSSCHDEKRDLFRSQMSRTTRDLSRITYHVDNGKYTRSVSQFLTDSSELSTPINTDNTESDIGTKVKSEEDELESSWQCSNIHG